MRFLPAFLVLVTAGALGNCRPPPTMAEACADRAFTACDLLEECRPIELSQRFGDHDTCVRRIALECTTNAALPSAVLKPSDVEDCVHELSSGGCDALGFPTPITPACGLILRGGGEEGAPCGDGIQCVSGACDPSPADPAPGGCGRCAPVAREGTPCGPTSGTNDIMPCATGLYCDPNNNLCFVQGQEGDRCVEPAPDTCDLGLLCVSGSFSGDWQPSWYTTCQRTRGEGDDCRGDAAGLCDERRELVCDAAAGECTRPAPMIAGVGDPCDPASRAKVACGPRSLCVETKTFGMSGTCKAVLDDDASCDPSSPVELCLFPARCIDGQCGLIDPPLCTDK